MGTVVGLGEEGGFLTGEGKLPGVNRVLLVDSVGAVFGGFANVSSNTTYIESAAGIVEGGRTGLTAVVVGILFLLCMFFSPLAGIIPAEATAPALILVGFLMMSTLRDIPWRDYEESIPAFLTLLLMPLTYSITNGIGSRKLSLTQCSNCWLANAMKFTGSSSRRPSLSWFILCFLPSHSSKNDTKQSIGLLLNNPNVKKSNDWKADSCNFISTILEHHDNCSDD